MPMSYRPYCNFHDIMFTFNNLHAHFITVDTTIAVNIMQMLLSE